MLVLCFLFRLIALKLLSFKGYCGQKKHSEAIFTQTETIQNLSRIIENKPEGTGSVARSKMLAPRSLIRVIRRGHL